MTPGLTDFLQDRLDEDEAAARAATPGPWVVGRTVEEDGEHYGSHLAAMGTEKRMLLTMTAGYTRSKHAQTAEHIARHDPARVLREVKAKRAILRAEMDRALGGVLGYSSVLLDLASIYSDHPDYRQEWKP